MSIIEGIKIFFFVTGAFLMFLAGVGIYRLPDIFLRMSAATKASTVGAGFLLLAASIHFEGLGTASRAIATIVFLFITAPVAAHRLARSAYLDRSPLWDGTVRDDLKGQYDNETHDLASDPSLYESDSQDAESEAVESIVQ